jgi:hypothetical protein
MEDFKAIAVRLYNILVDEKADAEDLIIRKMDPAKVTALLMAVNEDMEDFYQD